jgi:UDP-4-amino-4-deoxy-L-arabinose-oxoglutarate aminotransferase
MRVEFYKHNLGQEELNSLQSVFEGIFLTSGPKVRELESKLASFLGCADFVTTSSCTSALFLCLKALGIGSGDEVITTPLTFIATANSIVEAGAVPVFVDVESETGNIDAAQIESVITPRTKAILPVHLYGQMADMLTIKDIAARNGLHIIEDAAHCLEGSRDGVQPGQLSEAACFSFYATKNITCGEGGGVVTRDPALADKLRLLRSHGMSKEAADRYHGGYEHWDMLCMGYKANLDDIKAAILLPQLARIEDRWAKREALTKEYIQNLRRCDWIDVHQTLPKVKHARHLFTVLFDSQQRDAVLHRLTDHGVGVAVNYRPIHLLRFYRETFSYQPGMFPVAESIGSRTVSLPLYPSLSMQEVHYVLDVIQKYTNSLHAMNV